jgi:hypothetical protein
VTYHKRWIDGEATSSSRMTAAESSYQADRTRVDHGTQATITRKPKHEATYPYSQPTSAIRQIRSTLAHKVI